MGLDLVGPGAGTLTLYLLTTSRDGPRPSLPLVFGVLLAAATVTHDPSPRARHLPFMSLVTRARGMLGATLALALLHAGGVLGDARLGELLAAGAAGTVAVLLARERFTRERSRSVRTAVLGSRGAVDSLQRELRLAGVDRYELVGRIGADREAGSQEERLPLLGTPSELRTLVIGHDIHLLLMAADVSRLLVFDRLADLALERRVRLWELSAFTEHVFGHVPIASINHAWFQWILHPRYRADESPLKRPIDLVVALVVGVLLLPAVLVAALVVRRDGGPALFRQVRIGQCGRPFVLYKLRSMHLDADASAQWASVEDPRVTPFGRLLRRSHLDEVPQLINVLRGEMSLVGPRPEQPEFVERLEHLVPFYNRRGLVKPGITGWAQVLCGYAGSDHGSAWKLCHDLFYIKHRSLLFDLLILGETLRMVFVNSSNVLEPMSVLHIVQAEDPAAARLAAPPPGDETTPPPVDVAGVA